MSFTMQHDLTSMMGQRFYQQNSLAMRRSMQKLSSGLRVTIADVDNTASLAISETMRSRIFSAEKALQNTQDGVSLIQTALEAMDNTQTMITRMRELTVQASNDILTQQDRSYIQVEINELRKEITRLATNTQFNRKKILSGDGAVLWSSSNKNIRAVVNGGIRSLDQFGQKYSLDGNYNINVKAEEGKAQVQKSNIMLIKHDDVLTDKIMNNQAGAAKVEAQNIPSGQYNLLLEDPTTRKAVITSSQGVDDDAFDVQASAEFADNASILFEVTGKDDKNGIVTLKATANILTQSGEISNKVMDGIVLSEGGGSLDLGALLGSDSASIALNTGGLANLGKDSKFVVNVSAQKAGADSVGVRLESDNFVGEGAHYVLDKNAANNTEIHFNNYHIDTKTGTVSEARVTLTTNENFKNNSAASAGTALASFRATQIEETAKGDTRLRDIDKLWNSEGEFMLKEPKELTFTQGDGTQAKVMIYGEDTLDGLAQKMNDAIANGLGQSKYVDDATKFVTFNAEGHGTGLESVSGTMLVRSVVTGKKGEIIVSGNEDLIKALSLNTIQESAETKYNVTITDSHDGTLIAQDLRVTGNKLTGVIHKNVDIELDPLMGLEAKYDSDYGGYRIRSVTGSQGDNVTLHLSDNSSIFQVGSSEGDDVILSIGDMSSHALGLDEVNVMTQELSAHSLEIIDRAIDHISMQMASLGGAENRLEHHMGQLSKEIENLTDANSTIRDTDYAKEIVEYTKMQIQTSTATAMLAQAGQLHQSSILGLMR